MESRLNQSRQWRPFPELRNSEIIQILDELRIPITESDIMKPNPQTIQRIYELFLELFLGIPPSTAISQPTFQIVDLLENPEIHMDAISLMSFYKNISKLMSCVGIDDFSLKDVLKPEPSRIRIIFSGVINFAKFREEQLIFFDEFSSKAENLTLLKRQAESRVAELQRKHAALEKKIQDEQPAIHSLQEIVDNLSSELKELKKEQAQVSHSVEQLKSNKDEKTDRLSTEQYLIVTTRQEITKLQTRVVSNPEQLIKSLEEMSNDLAQQKLIIANSEISAKVLTNRNADIATSIGEVSKSIHKMNDCYETFQKTKLLESQLAADKENIAKKSSYSAEIGQKELQMRRQLSSQQEKIDKLNAQQSQKRAVIEESLKSLREEYEAVSKDRSAIQHKISINEKTIKEIENQIYETKKFHETEVHSLHSSFNLLKNQIGTYHSDIKKSLVL